MRNEHHGGGVSQITGGKSQRLAGHYLILVATGLLYLVYGVEAYLGHYNLLVARSWPAFLPLVYAALALVATVTVVFWPRPLVLRCFQWLMYGSFAVALVGLYFHGLESLPSWGALVGLQPGLPPLPAPLSFILPGIMGLVGTGGMPVKAAVAGRR